MKTAIEVSRAVAACMPGWQPGHRGEDNPHYAFIRRAEDAAEISIFVDRYPNKNRVEFRGGFPKFADGRGYTPNKYPRIMCGVERPAEALAREINRRLLPEFDPLYAEAVAYVKAHDKGAVEAMAVANRLATFIGTSPPRDPKNGASRVVLPCYGYPPVDRIEVLPGDSDTPLKINITLSDLDEAAAKRVLALALGK